MDGAGTGQAGGEKNGILIEIALARSRWADAEKTVCGLAVRRLPVRLRADGDRLEAELAAGALYPGGDLAAIGDEDGIEGAESGEGERWKIPNIGATTMWPSVSAGASTAPPGRWASAAGSCRGSLSPAAAGCAKGGDDRQMRIRSPASVISNSEIRERETRSINAFSLASSIPGRGLSVRRAGRPARC
jgi:hypothetical protein